MGEQIFQDGPNSQWIDFNFQSINGGPLASNFNSTWQISIDGVEVAQPALGSGFYFYWTVNGTPVTPIFPFGGFGSIAPIPTDPAEGRPTSTTDFHLTARSAHSMRPRSSHHIASSAQAGWTRRRFNGFHVGIRETDCAIRP